MPTNPDLAQLVEAHRELQEAIQAYRDLQLKYASEFDSAEKRIRQARANAQKIASDLSPASRRRRASTVEFDLGGGDDDILE